MRPVLIHRPDENPFWPGLADWCGLRVTSVPAVLELL
jgi:hypothetical protein